jgi:hypothetical protein
MSHDRDDIPYDVLEEMHDERQARRRANHWCDLCHGFTGPDSPCYDGPDPEPEEDEDAEES